MITPLVQFASPGKTGKPPGLLRLTLGTAFVLGLLSSPVSNIVFAGWGPLIFLAYFVVSAPRQIHIARELFSPKNDSTSVAQLRRAWLLLLLSTLPWLVLAAFVPNPLFSLSLILFSLLSLIHVVPPILAERRPFLDLVGGASPLLAAYAGYTLLGGSLGNTQVIAGAICWWVSLDLIQQAAQAHSNERNKIRGTATTLGLLPTLSLALGLAVASTILLYPHLGIAPVLFFSLPRALLLGSIYVGYCVVALVIANPQPTVRSGRTVPERLRQLVSTMPYLNILTALSIAFWLLE